jgi:hypothetical protein
MFLTHAEVARDGLALFCGLQGLGTVAIDMNRTHATNPLWTRHARFHVVWQTANTALLALLELALILLPGPLEEQRFYLASIMAGVPMLGFFAALIGRSAYGGSLSDPNGILPVKVKLFGQVRSVDLNLAAVLAGLITLFAIVGIYRL